MAKIPYFKLWCHTVLPLAYDNSLSYYELLCKVTKTLNAINETVGINTENITLIHGELTQLEEHLQDEVEEVTERVLNKWAEEGMFVKTVNGQSGDVTITAEEINAISNTEGAITNALLSDGIVTLSKLGNFGAENNGKRLAVNSTGEISLVTGEGVASGVESVNGMDGVVVINSLPNPQPINFAGGTQKSYDGVDSITIDASDTGAIPMVTSTHHWPLVFDVDASEWKPSRLQNDAIAPHTIELEKMASLGTSKSGEFVVVGSDGYITTKALNSWNGGSY